MSLVLTLRHHFTLSLSRKALLITSGVKHRLTIQRSRFLSWLILRTNLHRWIIKPSLKRLNLTIVSFWSAWLAFFSLCFISPQRKKEREKKREALLCLRDLLSLSSLLSLIISSSLDEAVQSLSLDSIHDSPSFSTFSSLSSSVLLLLPLLHKHLSSPDDVSFSVDLAYLFPYRSESKSFILSRV